MPFGVIRVFSGSFPLRYSINFGNDAVREKVLRGADGFSDKDMNYDTIG